MKNIKKLLALVLALAICAAFAIPAMANEVNGFTQGAEKVTISIDATKAAGHTYDVYQIFTGKVASETVDGKNVLNLSNVKVGSSYSFTLGEGDNAKNYTTGDDVPTAFLNEITDAEAFAQEVIAGTKGALGSRVGTLAASETGNNYSLPNQESGYYLIVDKGVDGSEAVLSAYMVQILGDTTLEPKTTDTTLEKSVANADKEGGWGLVADYDIDDEFQFKLEAKVPAANLPQYATGNPQDYTMKFTDTMSEGLTFVKFDSFVVKGIGDEDDIPIADAISGYELPEVTGQNFEVSFDLFQVIGSESTEDAPWPVDENGNIVVELIYTAKLNENAVIYPAIGADGKPNWNKASLEFRRDPYTDATGNTGDKEVYVYTFKINGVKVDGADNKTPLAGAGFKLYKYSETADDNLGEPLTFNQVGNRYVKAETPEGGEGTEIVTTESGDFGFEGLEEGKYVLVETTTPAGYNTMSNMVITISATESEDGKTLTATQTAKQGDKDITPTETEGQPIFDVVNNKGTNLPSTGGMGTTILYIVGGVLVVGAGVLLFTKKRMHG